MCVICDGASEDEVLFDMYGLIQRNGFTMTSVETSPPWTYTIGLAERFHPELVVTGMPADTAANIIWFVVDQIEAGMTFDECSPPLEFGPRTSLRFGPVHPDHWPGGLLAQWCNYYDALGDHGWLRREAIQVMWSNDGRFPPDPEFCTIHPNCQPLLDGPPDGSINGPSHSPRRPGSTRRRTRRRFH
jgi:hypothetical protein